jgi:hypothetical protein
LSNPEGICANFFVKLKVFRFFFFRFQGQKLGKLRARFVHAIEEAFLAERGFFDLESHSANGAADSEPANMAPGSSHGQEGSSSVRNT